MVRAGKEITLVISNEDLGKIIKIIKSLQDSSLLIDGTSEAVETESRKSRYFSKLLRTLGASMLGNIRERRTVKGVVRARKGFVRAGTGFNVNHVGQNF